MDKTILVTGATGQQGGAVARHLLAKGCTVRAFVRNPDKPGAQALAAKDARLVRGDFDDAASVAAALEGVDGAFLVGNFFETGYEGEVNQGKNFAEAAQNAGVSHLVYSSVSSAELHTGIAHFDSKFEVETEIRALGIPHTILRPTAFMENWETIYREQVLGGTISLPLSPDTKWQQVKVDDIGAFAALAFETPEAWRGQAVELAGDEPTPLEMAQKFSAALGRPVEFAPMTMEQARQAMGDELALMMDFFERVGCHADISALRAAYPPLATFDDFLQASSLKAKE